MAEAPTGDPSAPTDPPQPRWRTGWRRLPRRIAPALAVAIAVNLLVAATFLWSRGGETTTLTLEVRGSDVHVFLDGRETLHATYTDLPESGGIFVGLDTTTTVPGLPSPRGIDRVKVTELSSGETLFEDNFDKFDAERWDNVDGHFTGDDGVATIANHGVLRLNRPDWHDYRAEVRFKNIQGGELGVRSQDPTSGAVYTFRPFRHHDSNLSILKDGQPQLAVGAVVELRKTEVIRSLFAMWMRFYPLAIVTTIIVLALVFLLQFVPVDRIRTPRRSAEWMKYAPLAIVPIAVAAFAVTLYLNYSYGSHVPHVPDEVSYLFQAKLLSHGHFAAPNPPVEESFDFFFPPLIAITDKGWVSVYPFGHPLLLSAGELVGAPWIIPPLVGAGCVVMLFLFARRVYDLRVGLLAAALLALSPFFLMTASNFMSHNTATLYLLLSLFFLASGDRRLFIYSILAGVFFGLLFNTRPLTAFALVAPFGVMLLSGLIHRDRRLIELRRIGGFAAGGMLLLLAYWAYNYFTTGSLFTAGYQSGGDLSQAVGFGGAHSVARGIQNEQTQLAMLVMVLNNWPLAVGLMFVMLPFLLGTTNRWDWFALACAVFVMGAWTLYESPGLAHGPRYWYEAIPFLMLLAARGADRLAEVTAMAAAWVRGRAFGASRSARWAGVVIAYALIMFLAVRGSDDWLRGKGGGWVVDQMPENAKALKGYNGITDDLNQVVDDAHLENALVVVDPCPSWQCYGNVFWRNSPQLDGDIVFARNLPVRNQQLFQEFPDRKVYRARYLPPALVPWGVEFPVDAATTPVPDVSPPVARDIPSPTPQPTATPDVFAATRRDEQRRSDLELARRTVDEYYARHGSYPLAVGVQTFCQYDFDSACVLKEVLDPLPRDPQGAAYQYQSDGSTFYYIYASMELPPEPSECPDVIPDHLAATPNLYCASGKPPSGQ